MATSWNSELFSPSSTGWTTPLVTRLPSQSWAPMVMSGPLPVGTCLRKSSWILEKSLITRSTFTPDFAWKSAAASFRTGSRFASTHTLSEPASAGAEEDCAAVSEGCVDEGFEPLQAVRDSAAIAVIAPPSSRERLFTIMGCPFVTTLSKEPV